MRDVALVLLMTCPLVACGSPWEKDEQWSFALTRDILDRDWSDGDKYQPSCVDDSSVAHFRGGVEQLWMLAIFCLPTAIDLVLLPVTGVHDVCMD